ncbi:hypothetical protein M413DRAFT_89393 [Hebeloma cylindrosporum]|uniref:Ubiquitin thioesterase OTU n=1 Tax=Hebeloma cylindrosporum TaxID=76867 RepID=A0A0C2YGR1_HEBCY|nr:hypothetical protein M413DRAFT_89393 [Hebeloma cylindrosporum h7]
MAPIRLRHPKGVCTIEVSLEPEFTVQDLQQEIYAVSNILPSRQILKTGYPPRTLTLVPELPLQSIGIQRGDQIIVTEAAAEAPAPPPTSSPPRLGTTAPRPASGPDHVPLDESFLIHRVVPDDNSCLFSAAALVFEQSISKAPQMRKVVADGIRSNPETYTEAILGMPPSQYITTISKPASWGGAIELGILAAHYSTEISSVDVETGRIDHFSPGSGASTGMRAIFIYSGIHYDAASLAPMVEAPDEWHQTLFPIAFTNTSTFDLKCEQCGQGLKGEKGARAHAEQTGHVRFGEY